MQVVLDMRENELEQRQMEMAQILVVLNKQMATLNDIIQSQIRNTQETEELYNLETLDILKPLPCKLETRVLEQADFVDLYRSEWSNALCEDRKHLDVLGVGAYDNGSLVGLAACSEDGDTMWQIGIDVLPEYRRQGIASAITSKLAVEILERGKVPFYCCAWSNIKSAKNAIKSGFRPAWAQMTVKKFDMINEMNGIK